MRYAGPLKLYPGVIQRFYWFTECLSLLIEVSPFVMSISGTSPLDGEISVIRLKNRKSGIMYKV